MSICFWIAWLIHGMWLLLSEVKTLTIVVLLSLSLFSLTTQVITVWVTAYKGDTYGAVNL